MKFVKDEEIFIRTSLNRYLIHYKEFGIESESKAILKWNEYNNLEKYLICESREDDSTRLFIRNVTNSLDDALKKDGWWNTFTVTKNKTPKGIYICQIKKCKIDRNGYLNFVVDVILPVNDIKFAELFSFNNDGTWESVAWWFMIVKSHMFVKMYDFEHIHPNYHIPNIDELRRLVPEFEGMEDEEIAKETFLGYIKEEVNLDRLEEILNTPTEWENFIKLQSSLLARDEFEDYYKENYPNFSKKANNMLRRGDGYIYPSDVEEYLNRQLDNYNNLFKQNLVPEIEEGKWLDRIEAVLNYYAEKKNAEKAARKERRKEKKNKE